MKTFTDTAHYYRPALYCVRGFLAGLVAAASIASGLALADPFVISDASWSNRRQGGRLYVSGSGTPQGTINVVNAFDAAQVLGSVDVHHREGGWSIRSISPTPVPCRIRAMQSDGQTVEADVSNAPADCAPRSAGGDNVPPTADANGPYNGMAGSPVHFSSNGSGDSDGTIVSWAWGFGDGSASNQANPVHAYTVSGQYNVTLTVTDNDGASISDTTTAGIQDPANIPPTADANGPYNGMTGSPVHFSSNGSGDSNGTIVSWAWDFGDGSVSNQANPVHAYAASGQYNVTLTVTDNDGAGANDRTVANVQDPQPLPDISMNSTSQDSSGPVLAPVAEQPQVSGGGYSVIAINDLGMHCGDYDTRVASILPPFQVLLSQVIQKGSQPVLNPPGVALYYSAASNPDDPVLGKAGLLNGQKSDGSTYKTNFWDTVSRGAYDPFYPALVTPLSTGLPGATLPVDPDVGLPVPNVEALYIGADGAVRSGDEQLFAAQHLMPGVAAPYISNDPQPIEEHYRNKPFFVDFPFGYVANAVNWFEGAGPPFSAFDDFGRENAYPLVRVEAHSGGDVVATIDTVLPISGEASCSDCHAEPADVQDSRTGAPTDALAAAGLPVATSMDDPDNSLPNKVSVEYASDINILRLHDLKHGADYVDTSGQPAPCDISANSGDGDATCLTNLALHQDKPVVCQVCHYTPALDLAQVGPQAGPPGTDANGRNQLAHESNSRVMHNHHGAMTELFPPMPAPQQDANGVITNHSERLAVLEDTCYQCHPGKSAQCLRGAMFNAGMLCNDCHGDMQQVGADFSAGVSPDNQGAFQLDRGNFYDPGSSQPRVPWANEPGCGSCHTGDANDNLAGSPNMLVNTGDTHGNTDGIRLRQAWRTGDTKATPIVPVNKRFAEPAVPASFNGFDNPGAGNPKLYRLSTGHGGVFCEGCHGATHAEWPNANPFANDNVTAQQLQGHTGTIVECESCHETSGLSANTQNGPHGMHLVNDRRFWKEAHKDAAKHENGRPGRGTCGACHGSDHLGTVLSRAAADRHWTVEGTTRIVLAGEPVACNVCHSLSKSFGQ